MNSLLTEEWGLDSTPDTTDDLWQCDFPNSPPSPAHLAASTLALSDTGKEYDTNISCYKIGDVLPSYSGNTYPGTVTLQYDGPIFTQTEDERQFNCWKYGNAWGPSEATTTTTTTKIAENTVTTTFGEVNTYALLEEVMLLHKKIDMLQDNLLLKIEKMNVNQTKKKRTEKNKCRGYNRHNNPCKAYCTKDSMNLCRAHQLIYVNGSTAYKSQGIAEKRGHLFTSTPAPLET